MLRRLLRPTKWRVLTTIMAAPFVVSLLQCGAKPVPMPMAAPAISCTTSAICAAATNFPACGDPYSFFCQSVAHECMYRIKNDPNCLCLEKDIRACTMSGGGAGIQTCVTNASKNTTWWDTCHSC